MTELGMTPAARSRVATPDPRIDLPAIEFHETKQAADASIEKIGATAKRTEQLQ